MELWGEAEPGMRAVVSTSVTTREKVPATGRSPGLPERRPEPAPATLAQAGPPRGPHGQPPAHWPFAQGELSPTRAVCPL